MTRRNRVMAGVGVVAVVVAVLVGRGARQGGVEVDLAEVERREVFRSQVTASGEIVAQRFADIGSDAMGRVVALPVREGDRVEAGQLLAQIDSVPADSDLDAAEAMVLAAEAESRAAEQQLAGARAELDAARARDREARLQRERTVALAGSGLVAQSDVDAATATADQAAAGIEAAAASVERAQGALEASRQRLAQTRAQARRARDQRQKTAIVAPMDGVVSRLQVREGEMVVIGIQNQPGTTLMTISDLTGIHAEVKVAEADVLELVLGQRARVTLEAMPGRVFQGAVVEIGASALPQIGSAVAAREFRVVVRLDEPDPALRPGLTCDAEILTGERQGVLTVPLQAVVVRDGPPGEDGRPTERRGLFVLEDGRAVFTQVRTGILGGLDIEVEGVEEGTSVIAGPYQALRALADGDPVRPRAAGG